MNYLSIASVLFAIEYINNELSDIITYRYKIINKNKLEIYAYKKSYFHTC